MRHVFQNKYGCLILETVGPYRPVSGIYGKDVPAWNLFSLDQAEQIALITGNDGIQLCFPMAMRGKAFVIHHESASVAAVCCIVRLEFVSPVNPQQEIERLQQGARRIV